MHSVVIFRNAREQRIQIVIEIQLAVTDQDIRNCFPVMVQLRPFLSEDEFLTRVKRQLAQGYRLYRLLADGEVRAVTGFRLSESLGHGKFLYVDDLVADEAQRSNGHGGLLFDWLIDFALKENCAELRLDCAVHRFDAHRFYMRKRMKLTTHHFVMKLNEKSS